MPRVSIIIPTHSRPGLLPRAVESALGAGGDVEVVVVDDASADETAGVCRSLRGLTYVRLDRNQGVAGARNVGLLASSAEHVSFLDEDDVRLPGSLDAQVKALESAPEVGLVYAQALLGDQRGEPTGGRIPDRSPRGDVFWELLGRNFIPCGSAVFRRSCLYRVGMLDRRAAGVDDWDLWVRIAEFYPFEALALPAIVWRQSTAGSGQGSSKTLELISAGLALQRKRWLRLPRARREGRGRRPWREYSDSVSEHVIWETAGSLFSGDAGRAGKGLKVALRLHPLGPLGAALRWARPSGLRLLASEASAGGGLRGARARLRRARDGGRARAGGAPRD